MDLCTAIDVDLEEETSDQKSNEEDGVGITAAEAAENYRIAGTRVDCDNSSVSWDRYRNLYCPEVEDIVKQVVIEAQISYKLTDFQEIFLHSIGSKKDTFAVVNTGAGKTEVTGIAALVLRKVFDEPSGLIVIFIPLSGIMDELVDNKTIATTAVSMNGRLYSQNSDGQVKVKDEDILAGKYARLVMHPESLKNSNIEKLMLKLKQHQRIVGVIVDEFHVILPKHWASFRPEMQEQTARLRAFLKKGAPTAALSATATKLDVELTIQTLGMRGKPAILAENPIQSQHKFVKIARASDNYGFEGYLDQKSIFHPGLLSQLRVLVIDEYVRCILKGEEPKHTILFFRTENQLIQLINYLREVLGVSNARSAPFVSLVASTPPVTEMVVNARKGNISLYLTTQKMLMGVNIPKPDICIFIKPMNMVHSIIQGAGRTGRPVTGEPGIRTRAVVYILANGGDVGEQVKGMSEEMKDFVHNKGLVRLLMPVEKLVMVVESLILVLETLLKMLILKTVLECSCVTCVASSQVASSA